MKSFGHSKGYSYLESCDDGCQSGLSRFHHDVSSVLLSFFFVANSRMESLNRVGNKSGFSAFYGIGQVAANMEDKSCSNSIVELFKSGDKICSTTYKQNPKLCSGILVCIESCMFGSGTFYE